MPTLVVRHRVRDYDAWKPVFDEHEAVRRDHGARGHRVFRSLEDPNDVYVAVDFESESELRGFVGDPSLREAMERAGVEGEPNIGVLERADEKRY